MVRIDNAVVVFSHSNYPEHARGTTTAAVAERTHPIGEILKGAVVDQSARLCFDKVQRRSVVSYQKVKAANQFRRESPEHKPNQGKLTRLYNVPVFVCAPSQSKC